MYCSDTRPKTVPYHHEDRQWDARFNVQQEEDLGKLLDAVKDCNDKGLLKYILVGGVEIGTRAYQDDYQIKHVHVAAIFHNRISKRSILRHFAVKEGNGYYLVPRNRDFPYSGWKNHHCKVFSKVDPTKRSLFEAGTLPKDEKRKRAEASEEEKKLKLDDVIRLMRSLIEEGKEEEAFEKYPRNYLTYGEKIKAMVQQKREFETRPGDPHIWLYGYPGTGKTQILNYIYPKYYKKNLHNKYFDLYDPKTHTHIMLEDLDHEAVQRLGINFVKTLCDESGFPIDQKYKTPQLVRATVLVTSNFDIPGILTDGIEINKSAILRRFWHINIYDLLRLLGLKLLPKDERSALQKEGNSDPGKLFLAWDYMRNIPTGLPIKTPEEYQVILRDTYFAC